MAALASDLRKTLEGACVRGRRAAEEGCRAALGVLGVAEAKAPSHLSANEKDLRRGLRAKRRQLGDEEEAVDLLLSECAFEQWHRLLFARFLSENGLLIHPEFRAPVTLADCEELAAELGEPDGWGVAARFAAEILPGIFRLDDPCVRLRLAPESRLALEAILEGLPSEVFTSDDGLGWVYQYWQRQKKDEVNASERKIGGADLGPVTQLFTENYMVRFLLENSLGAWWAARHPESPLLKEWEYLRFDEEGKPAAGSFEGWPERVAGVTVMDPCCGSGHFLVEAFGMLWRMRMEEEGLSPIQAQDAVLRDNLFGLELDPRCTQITAFALALQAWKAGGGWRELPVPNIACSGIPVKTPVEEWRALAQGDSRLENALEALYILFKDAETLGSLIDPRHAVETSTGEQVSFDDVQWDEVSTLLDMALANEPDDPAALVLGADAEGLVSAARLLSMDYTLVTTNVPFLGRGRQEGALRSHIERYAPLAALDLATVFLERIRQTLRSGASVAAVSPEYWLFLEGFRDYRAELLRSTRWRMLARLGAGAFRAISGEVVRACLLIADQGVPESDSVFVGLDADGKSRADKQTALRGAVLQPTAQASQLLNPNHIVVLGESHRGERLADSADVHAGTQTGDDGRFRRAFWEVDRIASPWERFRTGMEDGGPYTGMSFVAWWHGPHGLATASPGAVVRGREAWSRAGVAVARGGELSAGLHTGGRFSDSVAVITPNSARDLPALWSYISSAEFVAEVRRLNRKLMVANNVLVQVPFDPQRCRRVAEEAGPLPEPYSDDPTQWLFEGRPEVATEPLQVGVGRLLGYAWPEQSESDDLDELADSDGIVCLPSVLGERPAAERLQELLARAHGATWSPARTRELLAASGSKKGDLESWLRDDFFKAHCQVFKNRPFVWHVWDRREDGFSALVNYHRLHRSTLQRLAYTYLGDWIERQTAAVKEDVAGAEARLVAAHELQRRLALILEGEPPYDISVRWKPLSQQPLGWDPDLNDGVRLNVRPFVEAEVLRAQFNVKWEKDRGKNPDGSERLNDLHYTLAAKRAARGGAA